MSELQQNAGARAAEDGVEPLGGADQPAKPIHTVIGAVALIACLAVCGNFFGWFGGKATGLGVSRERVEQPLSQSGLGFRPGSDQRGFPTEEATSLDGRSSFRLVGPKDDLVYVSITTNLADKATEMQTQMQVLYQISLVHTVFPDWRAEDIGRWINDAALRMAKNPAVAQIEERRGNAIIKVSVSRTPLAMTVSVESGRW